MYFVLCCCFVTLHLCLSIRYKSVNGLPKDPYRTIRLSMRSQQAKREESDATASLFFCPINQNWATALPARFRKNR
jgi:hypothetical protein